MINLLLCTAFGGFIACIVWICFGWDLDAKSETILCAIMLIFILIGAGFGIYGTVQSKNHAEWKVEQTSTEPVVALQDNSGLTGRFYMRSGYINSEEYYYYLVKLNNGGYKSNKVKTATATIFETDSNYRVEWYTRTRGFWFTKEIQTFHYVYIPEGAMCFDYAFDLQ